MQIGAIINEGPQNWQIIQQVDGAADIRLSGKFHETDLEKWNVYARVVEENTSDVVIPWELADKMAINEWEITLCNVPAGGLYRIETCLLHDDHTMIGQAVRGDMINFVGVGDVYVITGQSNSAGYGREPVNDPPEIGVHMLANNGVWRLATHPLNESTDTIHDINREDGNPGHSPYLNFARILKNKLNYPIGLVQTSLGGSPLSEWNPEEGGGLYRNMMDIIDSQGGKIKGILWYQGCSDADGEICDSYLDRFDSFVSHTRKELNDEDIHFLTVQLNRYLAKASKKDDEYWGKIREAQRQAAKQINKVYIVPSTDCMLSDAIHNSSFSNMVLGERLAKSALHNIYKNNNLADPPDISTVAKNGDKEILIMFDSVVDQIYTFEMTVDELPFTVVDDDGEIALTDYSLIGTDCMILKLEGNIVGQGYIHGAHQQNPKMRMPIDYFSKLPLLSFYNVKIEE